MAGKRLGLGQGIALSTVFPKNSRAIAGAIAIGLLLLGGLVTLGVTYYFTPKYTRVGYEPIQPIPYSHKIHVGQLGLDCTYCHTNVAEAPHANIPATNVCMNCHDPAKGNIKGDSPLLAPLREASKTGMPINWVRVHKLPDYVYFNHQIHVNRGVGCVECHGRVDQMPEVREVQPLSMSWCLDCHRDPQPRIRPNQQVTNLAWDPIKDWPVMPQYLNADNQMSFAEQVAKQSGLKPPTNCSACHR